jgi:hypothetical protein
VIRWESQSLSKLGRSHTLASKIDVKLYRYISEMQEQVLAETYNVAEQVDDRISAVMEK